VYPLKFLGVTGDFWSVHLDTLLYTWIAMGGLLLLALIGKRYITDPLNPFCYMVEQTVEFFANLCIESFGFFRYNYFALITSLFFFSMACSIIGAFPFIDESTKDLNTTLAIAFASFLYVENEKIKKVGIWPYIKEFFLPIPLLLPLNIINKFAKVVSMSFRLFGNILGGSIVFFLLLQVIAQFRIYFIPFTFLILIAYWLLSKIPDERKYPHIRRVIKIGWYVLFALAGAQMFFSIFEGVIQAFVISMLTITYLSVAISGEKSHKEKVS
jgi:F-type H+-transporting ATPase subunit a